LLAAGQVAALHCISDVGQPIDYWTLLKYPNGYAYSYADSTNEAFEPSTAGSLDAQKGAAYNTLQQIYGGNSQSIAYAMFNDAHPDGKTTSGRAHQKGVLAFDGTGHGFWIIHSMPKWPRYVKDGQGPLPDKTYGQHFHCVTFPITEIEKIATQLQVTWPWIYDMNLPANMAPHMINFKALLDGKHPLESTANWQPLKSSGGVDFMLFAKNKQSSLNLYEELIAYRLQTDMYTRTWQNGVGNLGSFCRPNYQHEVEDISELTLNGQEYNVHQDHSKWAISANKGSNFVCFGGINRQKSQTKRGGGSLCHVTKAGHDSLQKAATDTNSCPFANAQWNSSSKLMLKLLNQTA